nr:MAG TPA: hypothetical protein [Caudoviricetes sp.]
MMSKKIITRKENLLLQEDFFRSVTAQITETEQRRKQKQEEFENVKQCGARLTKHRFTY